MPLSRPPRPRIVALPRRPRCTAGSPATNARCAPGLAQRRLRTGPRRAACCAAPPHALRPATAARRAAPGERWHSAARTRWQAPAQDGTSPVAARCRARAALAACCASSASPVGSARRRATRPLCASLQHCTALRAAPASRRGAPCGRMVVVHAMRVLRGRVRRSGVALRAPVRPLEGCAGSARYVLRSHRPVASVRPSRPRARRHAAPRAAPAPLSLPAPPSNAAPPRRPRRGLRPRSRAPAPPALAVPRDAAGASGAPQHRALWSLALGSVQYRGVSLLYSSV